MIKIMKYGQVPNSEIFARVSPAVNVEAIVADIIANVRANGDRAVLEYNLKFDKAQLETLLVSQQEIDEAFAAVEPEFLELVQDAYSPKREVQIEHSTLMLPVKLDEKMEYIPVEHPLSGQTGRVVDARFLPDFPRKRVAGYDTELEVTGRFQALSYSDEGILQGLSSRWEGNMPLRMDDACNMMVTVKSSGKVQTMTSIDDISLNTQLQLTICCGKLEQLPMVIGAEIGELQETDPSRPSVILMNGEGEPLWDIAKRSNSTVEAIRKVNELEGEYAPERMILIPVL